MPRKRWNDHLSRLPGRHLIPGPMLKWLPPYFLEYGRTMHSSRFGDDLTCIRLIDASRNLIGRYDNMRTAYAALLFMWDEARVAYAYNVPAPTRTQADHMLISAERAKARATALQAEKRRAAQQLHNKAQNAKRKEARRAEHDLFQMFRQPGTPRRAYRGEGTGPAVPPRPHDFPVPVPSSTASAAESVHKAIAAGLPPIPDLDKS